MRKITYISSFTPSSHDPVRHSAFSFFLSFKTNLICSLKVFKQLIRYNSYIYNFNTLYVYMSNLDSMQKPSSLVLQNSKALEKRQTTKHYIEKFRS